MKFTQFNRNVIYFIAPKLGFGFVWRRQNSKRTKLGWLKFTYQEKFKDYDISVVAWGYNPFNIISNLRKPDPYN